MITDFERTHQPTAPANLSLAARLAPPTRRLQSGYLPPPASSSRPVLPAMAHQPYSDRDNDALSALSALASSLQPNSFHWPTDDVSTPTEHHQADDHGAGVTTDWDVSAVDGLVEELQQQQHHHQHMAHDTDVSPPGSCFRTGTPETTGDGHRKGEKGNRDQATGCQGNEYLVATGGASRAVWNPLSLPASFPKSTPMMPSILASWPSTLIKMNVLITTPPVWFA